MRYDVPLQNFNDGAGRAHMIRYYVARGFVTPKDRVADAACGTGYGSKMLSEVAETVYAYDQLDFIKHEAKNIVYTKADISKFSTYYEVDIGISLETIEHLTREEAVFFLDSFMPRCRKWFIFSVPLNEEPGANPFHKQTFTRDSAMSLVERPGWNQFHTLLQGNHLLGFLWRQ